MRTSFKAALLATTVALAPFGAMAQVAGFGGNLLVNPWMEIDQLQEGGTTTVTSTAAATFTYGGGGSAAALTLGTTDGWGMTDATTSASNTLKMQQAAVAPNGSVDDMKVTIGTGSATRTDQQLITIEQRIEPTRIAPLQYGTANAQPAYLSFCAKASIAGTYSFYLAGGTAARTSDIPAGTSGSAYFHQFSIPTASQFSCYQFTIPGDTGGTWLATTATVDATHGMTLGFVLDLVGAATHIYSTPSATQADGVWQNTTNSGALAQVIGNGANQVTMGATSGATFELTGVKLSLDPSPLVHAPEFELLQAQRYLTKTFTVGVGGVAGVKPAQNLGVSAAKGYASGFGPVSGGVAGISWPFPVPMRASPTVITYDPKGADSNCSELVGANTSAATIEPNITSNVVPTTGVYIGCAALTMTATGNRVGVGITADARL